MDKLIPIGSSKGKAHILFIKNNSNLLYIIFKFEFLSVEGMKFDYIAYNITGYLFYGIANTFGYFGNPSKTGLPNVSL